MKFKNTLYIAETHTAGNPTRHVLLGVPPLSGETMEEKMIYFETHFDHIRRIVTMEPRGNSCMSGVIYTTPCNKNADIGAFFFEQNGYLGLCGHSIIAAATVLIELGMVSPDKYGCISIDTPAGLIKTIVNIDNDEIKEVSFYGVPSFLYASKAIMVDGFGKINTEVAFGGVAYAISEANSFGLRLKKENINKILEVAIALHNAAEKQIGFCYPGKMEKEHIHGAILVERLAAEPNSAVVAVVSIPSESGAQPFLDRSPCGAGTCARVASEYANDRISIKENIMQRSLIGTEFKGMANESVIIKNRNGCIPQVTGRAHFTAFMNIVIDPNDKIQNGFIL